MGRAALNTGAHIVRKRNRSGIVWYVYAWRRGPQVYRADGPRKPKLTPEVLRAIADAHAAAVPRQPDNLRSLIRLWRSTHPGRSSSPDWEALADSTKRTWGSALNVIEAKWGDVPLAVFDDGRMRAKVVDWRDSRSATPRAADIGVTVLRALLRFGMLKGKVLLNVAEGVPSLYRNGQRAEIIWTESDIVRFCAKADDLDMKPVADALRLAAMTGLRRDDLVSLEWTHVTDFGVTKKAKKLSRGKRRFASIPTLPELSDLLDDLRTRHRAKDVARVLVDGRGRPWVPNSLSRAVAKVRDAAEVIHVDPETGERRELHLHDARGTFATRLMTTSDLTDQQLAQIMGWSPENVARIRNVYVDQSAQLVALRDRIGRGGVNR